MIFKSNVFRFGNEYYRQITGTANFEQSLLRDYSQKNWIITFGMGSF